MNDESSSTRASNLEREHKRLMNESQKQPGVADVIDVYERIAAVRNPFEVDCKSFGGSERTSNSTNPA